MAATSSRTPTHLAKGKIRNGSILYGSTRVISGAPTQIQTLAYRWTHGSHIWSRPSKLPEAYWGLRTRADLAVEEFLRFISPVQFSKPRFMSQDMDLGGARLKSGD